MIGFVTIAIMEENIDVSITLNKYQVIKRVQSINIVAESTLQGAFDSSSLPHNAFQRGYNQNLYVCDDL